MTSAAVVFTPYARIFHLHDGGLLYKESKPTIIRSVVGRPFHVPVVTEGKPENTEYQNTVVYPGEFFLQLKGGLLGITAKS